MINGSSLLVGGLISSSVGLMAGFTFIDSESYGKLCSSITANNGQWNEEILKLYQQTRIEAGLQARKLLCIFPLAYASGVLAGGFIAKKIEKKFDLQGDTKKEVCRVGIIFTITALFTFCFTKSVRLSVPVRLSAINAVVTAIWQKILPLKI